MAVTMVIGNHPEIARVLFAPGYTLASVIANEFTEATGDLYLSALIEIGLALFLVTIVVNAIARLMVWAVTRGAPARAAKDEHTATRQSFQPTTSRHVHALRARRSEATIVIGACRASTIIVLVPLAAILVYLHLQGRELAQSGVLHHVPAPVGETGGGMANSIVGSGIILALASVMGIPIGIAAGVYLAEYGRGRLLGNLIRFTADVLNGVPSIVMGIAVYCADRHAQNSSPRWPAAWRWRS